MRQTKSLPLGVTKLIYSAAGAVRAELAAGACAGVSNHCNSWRSGGLQEADQGGGGRSRERPLTHGRRC